VVTCQSALPGSVVAAALPSGYGTLRVLLTYHKWEWHTLTADERESIFMSDLFALYGIKR
jgi:hypothetical protein